MTHYGGFVANILTSTLVNAEAIFGLPMSTTRVLSLGIDQCGAMGEKGNLQ